jgi:hypothetical protein
MEGLEVPFVFVGASPNVTIYNCQRDPRQRTSNRVDKGQRHKAKRNQFGIIESFLGRVLKTPEGSII